MRAKNRHDRRVGQTGRIVAKEQAVDGLLVRYLGVKHGYPWVRALEPLPADGPGGEGPVFVWSVHGDGRPEPWIVWTEDSTFPE